MMRLKKYLIIIIAITMMLSSCKNGKISDYPQSNDLSDLEQSDVSLFESSEILSSDIKESLISSETISSESSAAIASSSANSALPSISAPTSDYEKYEWEDEVEAMADKYATTQINIDMDAAGQTVKPGVYSAGYDGWGDITDERSLTALKEVNLHYLRIVIDLDLATGNTPGGPIDITCKAQKDGNLTLVQRIRHAQENGFTPILVFSTNHSLPSYFYPSQDKISYWFQYDTDGNKATNHIGDQIDEYARIAGEVARQLKDEGLAGLIWESIYEIGYGYTPFGMTPVSIHYKTAKAIKEMDSTSKHIGPATWTGWAVEKFVDDYFMVYGREGAQYLDYVSFHQYGGNYVIKNTDLWDGNRQLISMVMSDDHVQNGLPIKNLSLLKILSSVPKAAAESVLALRNKLKSMGDEYGFDKTIGVAVTEYDVNNYSNYHRNPSNENYPEYDPASDTNINTNYFGGVNTAYMITSCAFAQADMLIKFNTRQYYGIVDHDYENGGKYYRTPLWFSLKLLQEKLGLTAGAEITSAQADGPKDTISGYDQPWIYVCTVKNNGKTNILIINRSDTPLNVNMKMKNIESDASFNRYIYSDKTTADFIGNNRPTGSEYDGIFEGGINDGWEDYKKGTPGNAKNICLFSKGVITPESGVAKLTIDKFSYVVLEMTNE